MPKISKKSIKTYKTYPTLKTFKYVNSEVYHFVMYVGTILKEINNKKVMSLYHLDHVIKSYYHKLFKLLDCTFYIGTLIKAALI